MVAVGPTAGGVIAASRRRLLALIRAGDVEGAAREMERHIRGMLQMRVSRDRARADVTV